MENNLISEIVDLNKVKANLLEVQKLWENLITTMSSKSSKDLKFDDVAKNLNLVTEAEKKLATVKKASQQVDEKKQKITAEIIASYDKADKETKKLIENEIKHKHEVAETNKQLKERFTNEQNLTKVLQRETKSIADLDKQNKDLQRIQQKLNITTKEGVEANAKINAQIEKNKQTTKEYTNAIDKQKREIGNYPNSVNKMGAAFAGAAASMMVAFAAIKQIGAVFKESIALFIEQEKQAFRVGEAFGDYAKTINDAADANQNATTVGNEQYQKLAVLANAFGVANEKVNDTVKLSLGLSTRFEAAGVSQEAALKMIVKAQNGQYMALKKVIPEIANAKNQQEALNIINEAGAKGYATLTKYAETYGGRMIQVKNIMGDLKEEVGGQFLGGLFDAKEGAKVTDTINGVIVALQKSEVIKKYFEAVRDMANQILAPIKDVAAAFGITTNSAGLLSAAFEFLGKWMKVLMVPSRVFWTFIKTITEAISPIITNLVNTFEMLFGNIETTISFTDILNGVMRVFAGVINFVLIPFKLFMAGLQNVTKLIKSLIEGFKGIKELNVETIFNLIKESLFNLIKPFTDVIGMSGKLAKLLGVDLVLSSDNAGSAMTKMTNEIFSQFKELSASAKELVSIVDDFFVKLDAAKMEQIATANEAAEAEKKRLDAIKAANDAAISAQKSFNDAIKKANEEARLSIELGESVVLARKKEAESIYSAAKSYYESNGYTADEIEKLKELKAEIDKLNVAIENNDSKRLSNYNIEKYLAQQKKLKEMQKEANMVWGDTTMTMRDTSTAGKEAADGFTQLEKIIAKTKILFDMFFGTEQIEDWRETFKESLTSVVNESLELFNSLIEIQNVQLQNELDGILSNYDKKAELLEAEYEHRKNLIIQTISDEEQQAAALARLEAEKTEIFNKNADERILKEQEIARKKAILEKKKAEMEIATGSATALIEAIKLIGIATTAATPGDPYSLIARVAAALAAALTVVTAVTSGIAKVKAITIPEFYKGGDAEKGQLISVAERGREVGITESGKAYLFDKQSYIVAPENMRILNNKETNQVLEKQTINNNYEKQSNVNLTIDINNERHRKYFKLK